MGKSYDWLQRLDTAKRVSRGGRKAAGHLKTSQGRKVARHGMVHKNPVAKANQRGRQRTQARQQRGKAKRSAIAKKPVQWAKRQNAAASRRKARGQRASRQVKKGWDQFWKGW